jgi:hypothetical protein
LHCQAIEVQALDPSRRATLMGHDSVQEVQPKAARRHDDQNRLREDVVAGLLQAVVEVCKQQSLAGLGSSTYTDSGSGDDATPFVHDAAMRA